jgi:hypothetical protein
MKCLPIIPIVVLAGGLVFAADTPDRDKAARADVARADASSAGTFVPPVLRNAEAADSMVVTLPGSAPKPVSPAPSQREPAKIASVAVRRGPAVDPEPRPVVRHAPKPTYPPDFEKESAVFCQRQIGQWTEADASALFGAPLRQRPAYDEGQVESGLIYAFSDPTNRYREMELDFARNTGRLRTVFVYPWKMTWKDCRSLWGANVTSTEANKGRTFYSYVNRHLDVLVDPSGKVISLGMY